MALIFYTFSTRALAPEESFMSLTPPLCDSRPRQMPSRHHCRYSLHCSIHPLHLLILVTQLQLLGGSATCRSLSPSCPCLTCPRVCCVSNPSCPELPSDLPTNSANGIAVLCWPEHLWKVIYVLVSKWDREPCC